ncbi:hypothetical protein PPERSA_12346 [Pseudocohnilembus persalinus]|uniref:Uncharacterized protein n=1 Tax=Pseudocohnilembus persalinus TaxID=266149 RepID=A0A0V0R0W3_PSEPJ|nr:hypothetical protein PPERSA_12346 [Pseudocohnilembus persalinus]|eukprot:KRX08191.1 hypothetical protein PPERSA_12346 [Pseudocohnilembus persalinus]
MSFLPQFSQILEQFQTKFNQPRGQKQLIIDQNTQQILISNDPVQVILNTQSIQKNDPLRHFLIKKYIKFQEQNGEGLDILNYLLTNFIKQFQSSNKQQLNSLRMTFKQFKFEIIQQTLNDFQEMQVDLQKSEISKSLVNHIFNYPLKNNQDQQDVLLVLQKLFIYFQQQMEQQYNFYLPSFIDIFKSIKILYLINSNHLTDSNIYNGNLHYVLEYYIADESSIQIDQQIKQPELINLQYDLNQFGEKFNHLSNSEKENKLIQSLKSSQKSSASFSSDFSDSDSFEMGKIKQNYIIFTDIPTPLQKQVMQELKISYFVIEILKQEQNEGMNQNLDNQSQIKQQDYLIQKSASLFDEITFENVVEFQNFQLIYENPNNQEKPYLLLQIKDVFVDNISLCLNCQNQQNKKYIQKIIDQIKGYYKNLQSNQCIMYELKKFSSHKDTNFQQNHNITTIQQQINSFYINNDITFSPSNYQEILLKYIIKYLTQQIKYYFIYQQLQNEYYESINQLENKNENYYISKGLLTNIIEEFTFLSYQMLNIDMVI